MDHRSETRPMGQAIQIDEARIRNHPDEMVRGTVAAGRGRRDRGGLPGDPRHLRGRQGGQAGLVGVSAPPGRPRACGRRADHLGRLPRPRGECRRIPARDRLTALCRAFLPQRLQPRATGQGPRGQPHAEGDPCPGEPGCRRRESQGHRQRPCRGDAHLLRLTGQPLDQAENQRPAGARHARDPAAHPRGRRLSRTASPA